MVTEEDIPGLKRQFTDLLREEAQALQAAIALSQSHAPHAEVSAAIRQVDQIKSERTRLARLIQERERGGG